MWGAIIGKIVGSIYELLEEKKKSIPYKEMVESIDYHIPLFTDHSSCLNYAFLIGPIVQDKDYEKYLQSYIREKIKNAENDLAMLVGPISYIYDDLKIIEQEARLKAILTNNTDDFINASQAIAATIYLVRHGVSKENIKTYLSFRFHYSVDYDFDGANCSFRENVIRALNCFFISNSFEDGLSKCVLMEKNNVIITTITCSFLEACYGVPDYLINEAKKYLNDNQLEVITNFYQMINQKKKEKKISYEENC